MRTSLKLLLISSLGLAANANAQPKKDSVDARRKATSAQARFESVRRQHLPISYGGGGEQCDARIGRFCQWNNDYDTIEAKMPRVIHRARETLIASLDSAQKKSPRDGWITGQRVRYRIEARNDTAALRVAHECLAAEWWCAALEGLALQQNRQSGDAADSAFARALRAMPENERCKWTDMTPILSATLRSRFKKVGCTRNTQVAERLWWLSDPFWSRSGNERRAEHYARHAMAKIQEPARNAYNIAWANDLREMVVRYGWARYWTKSPGSALDPSNGSVAGHEATPNYHVVPVSLTADTMPNFKFDLDLDASTERYASVTARRIYEIEPQIAVFRRGDSSRVVVAYDVSGRRQLDAIPLTGFLALGRDEKTPMVLSSDTAARRGALSAMIESRNHVLSLEVIDTVAYRGAAWSRSVLPVKPNTRGVALSDPLMFEPTGTDAGDLESAKRTAIGGNVIKRGKVGLYWEMYGLTQGDSTRPVSLTLTRINQNALRKLGESIGLASRMSPLRIQWNQFETGAIAYRSVVLDLSLIPRGRYVLRIDAGTASTSRTLEIE